MNNTLAKCSMTASIAHVESKFAGLKLKSFNATLEHVNLSIFGLCFGLQSFSTQSAHSGR